MFEDSLLEESGFEPSVPRCARTAESAAMVRRRLIRPVSGGSSDSRSTTRSVCRGRIIVGPSTALQPRSLVRLACR